MVTGIGAVTPIGNDIDSFWSAARSGHSGVRRPAGFDSSDLNVQVAAEVQGFDPATVLKAKDRQHLPRAVPLGIAAGGQALGMAGAS